MYLGVKRRLLEIRKTETKPRRDEMKNVPVPCSVRRLSGPIDRSILRITIRVGVSVSPCNHITSNTSHLIYIRCILSVFWRRGETHVLLLLPLLPSSPLFPSLFLPPSSLPRRVRRLRGYISSCLGVQYVSNTCPIRVSTRVFVSGRRKEHPGSQSVFCFVLFCFIIWTIVSQTTDIRAS